LSPPAASGYPPRHRVVAFGTYDTLTHPRAAVIMDGLRARGFEVEECNSPLGLGTASRVAILKKGRKVPAMAGRIVGRWVSLLIRSKGTAPADAVLVPYMGHFDVHLARLRFRPTPILLDHLISGRDTARDRGATGPLRERLLGMIDDAAIRAADVVIVDTDEHLALIPASAQQKAVVVPVGATDAWVGPRRALYDGLRPLKVIFFGLFTPLQGAVIIGRALDLLAERAEVEVTMVGEGQDLETAKRQAAGNPFVRWYGMVPAAELPALLAEHDVCLGIFGDNDKGRRVVPNKVYQGVRAGCAILTSDTPPQRRVLGDSVAYVPAGDSEALAAALTEMASCPQLVADLQSASRSLSDQFGPEAVVGPLVERLAHLVKSA
jgi:glycosyltransferase involved in cell wall biosynthesis